MPSHELGIDLVDLRLQLRIFLGLDGEQLSRRCGTTDSTIRRRVNDAGY
jgi:hypothetical protein